MWKKPPDFWPLKYWLQSFWLHSSSPITATKRSRGICQITSRKCLQASTCIIVRATWVHWQSTATSCLAQSSISCYCRQLSIWWFNRNGEKEIFGEKFYYSFIRVMFFNPGPGFVLSFKHVSVRSNAEAIGFYHSGPLETWLTNLKLGRLLQVQQHLINRQFFLNCMYEHVYKNIRFRFFYPFPTGAEAPRPGGKFVRMGYVRV